MMRRALIAIAALLTAWISVAPVSAAVTLPAATVTTHTYDAPAHFELMTDDAAERGPPAPCKHTITCDAVDSGSHGASARPAGVTIHAETTCNDPTGFVLVAQAASATRARAQVRAADVSAYSLSDTAANGGAASVRLGQAGENAVRSAFDIGPKATAQIGGRTRIFDGLNDVAVSEVKNVKYQAYTQQLKDSLAYAQQNGLRFDLYVRGGASPTTLSGPLEAAIRNGDIGLRYIP